MSISVYDANAVSIPRTPGGMLTIEQIGDNADDNSAFVAAFASISAGAYGGLSLGAKSYAVGTGGLLPPPNSSIVGQGPGPTTVSTTANNDIFRCINSNRISIRDLHLLGNSTGANQIGINVGFSGPTDGTSDALISNVVFENLGAAGVGGGGLSLQFGPNATPGATVSNCHTINCATGFIVATQAQLTGCTSRGGSSTGLDVQQGNVVFSDGDLSQCLVGVRIRGTGNTAHGVISNTQINHCGQYGILVDDYVSNGQTFSACHVYASPIKIGGNGPIGGNPAGLIKFVNCVLDPSSWVFSSTSKVLLDACTFPQGNFLSDNGKGAVKITNPRHVTGDLPAWIAARMYPKYTFPADGDQTLPPQICYAEVLDIQAGVVTVARKITNGVRGPAQGERIRVVNRTTVAISYYWRTGNGVTIPAGTTYDVGADGTNATCETAPAAALPAPTGILDPSTLALNGWYRGTWGVPWNGTDSIGTSGDNSLTTAGSDPVAGLTLNGYQAANFAGTHWLTDTTSTSDKYLSTTAYRIHFLIFVTGTSAPAGSIFNNPGIVTDSGGSFGVVIDTAGIHVVHGAVLVASSFAALGITAWHDVDILFDGAHVTVTVDGVAGTPGATTNTGLLSLGNLHVGSNWNNSAQMNCQLMDLALAPTSLASTTAAQFKATNNARYGLAL